MPGLELFTPEPVVKATTVVEVPASEPTTPTDEMIIDGLATAGVYYNARLDPKNFLEGPLSLNPATRLRQMLARPGIVVSLTLLFVYTGLNLPEGCPGYLRRYQRAVRD